ncbi:MAG: DegT/DnrJ/EryC1/StrS family aminotransferase [Candidatus Rokubacteria bacterium]|nr:DegT/DnrJ/EryC1/StrS family aminotransferase [Candidatus Rokubacteria bacterium]
MDSELREKALTDRIRLCRKAKAVIVVHLYGLPADMDAIVELCARHEVPLVEDAAECLGATYKGRHTGTIGRFGWSCAGELCRSPPTDSLPPATVVRMSYCKT